MATPTLAYRGSALRGRGRAVYNTIRSAAAAAATPAAVQAYPGSVTLQNNKFIVTNSLTNTMHTRQKDVFIARIEACSCLDQWHNR